ncbi:hypothetical protein EOA85_26660 [Mesorhizobium sp. M5C.F.Ca.IN.020.29.1.1]|uniref:hypothetical protein n=1 Tax=unclassified Mesorhizobium TaxID=325217 RepID=UPI000FCBFB84|nr:MULTISPECIES: hypothetical protein [unclassified Mesorhizobium]RUV53967.1 hypothetical protein EOA85_26660 [Mesorhizobium sp. M5C.F.Ca.IN.020.29.1.1]TIM85071.1 MAG: hypothetical protein E5Y50_20030 [Mesorhizobium sp.]
MMRFQQNARPRTDTPAHLFGQTVRMKSRIGLVQKTAELFQIKSKLPVKDGSPQYRIRSDEETYERVTTEDNLEVADNPSA